MGIENKTLTKDQVLFLWEELNNIQEGKRCEISYERSFEVVVMATRLQKEWSSYLENQPVNVAGEVEEFNKISEKLLPLQRYVHDYEALDVMQYIVVINIVLRLAASVLSKELEINQVGTVREVGAEENRGVSHQEELIV